MIGELSQDDAEAILLRLRQKVPPDRIGPTFVKTRTSQKILDKAHNMLDAISKLEIPGFLIIKAIRGAGKTAILQYLKEQFQDEVFFAYLEKSSTSAENLFRFFVNRTGKQTIKEAVQSLSTDPMEVYNTLSEVGHNGTAIALAGLLEDNPTAWSWLSTRASHLIILGCGLHLTRNVRDEDSLDALATVVKLLAYQKPVVFAIDELEGAYNELSKRNKVKLQSLLVDLVNHTRFSRILFLFAATEHVYKECFMGEKADETGLTRRVEDSTSVLGLPNKDETRKILERVLYLYSLAKGFEFTETDIRRIKGNFNTIEAMPSDTISYALQRADEKWEFIRNYRRIINLLETESAKIMEGISPTILGRKFEEAVGLLLKYFPDAEYHIPQPTAIKESECLSRKIENLGRIHKYLDWSFRLDAKDFWVEVCNTGKKDSVIPSEKAVAMFAKTLYNEGSAGLFVTHNYQERFSAGRGAGRVYARNPELKKRVAILNLDDEQLKLLIGLLGAEEEDRKIAAQFLFEKTGLEQIIKDLESGKHFFW
jgi:hypothetical protein